MEPNEGMARVLGGIYEGAVGGEAEWEAGLGMLGVYLGAEAVRVTIRREGAPVSMRVEWPEEAGDAVSVWSMEVDEQTVVTLDAEGPVDAGRLSGIAMHLERAVGIWFELTELRGCHAIAAGLLDRFRGPVAMVDGRRCVAGLNRRAEALVGRVEGFDVTEGRLTSRSPRENRRLEVAIGGLVGEVDDEAPCHSVVWQQSTASPVSLVVVPVEPEGDCALIIFHPRDAEITVDRRILSDLYNLTLTEARICSRLAKGESVADIAEGRRCSESTVRTHIKHILRKTETNRQAELVALILGGPAGLVGS